MIAKMGWDLWCDDCHDRLVCTHQGFATKRLAIESAKKDGWQVGAKTQLCPACRELSHDEG
jgi:hypothetical protein